MYPLFSRARQWVLTYCIICMSSVHSAYHICLLRVDQFCTVHANNNLLANSVLMFVQCIDIICKSPKRSWAFFFFYITKIIVIFLLYVLIILCFIVSTVGLLTVFGSIGWSILCCTFVVWSHCSLFVR